jgi:hypothetical protein
MKLSEFRKMTEADKDSYIIEAEALLGDIACRIWDGAWPDKMSADHPLQVMFDWVRPYWRNDPCATED